MSIAFGGPAVLLLIVVAVILIFGWKRIPEMLKSVFSGVKEMKSSQEEEQSSSQREEKK